MPVPRRRARLTRIGEKLTVKLDAQQLTLRVHYEDKKYPVPAYLDEMEFERLRKIADGVVVCQQHSKD